MYEASTEVAAKSPRTTGHRLATGPVTRCKGLQGLCREVASLKATVTTATPKPGLRPFSGKSTGI
jgi:hypothetical protein